MNILVIIVGIDGWEKYTKPLIDSIEEHCTEDVAYMVVDNASATPYPQMDGVVGTAGERLCYSEAINYGWYAYGYCMEKHGAPDPDWIVVLSNDVLCTGPFEDILAEYDGNDLVGPCLKRELGFDYLEGWCVAVPARAWQPWDERFLGSDYEDVAFSTAARQRGFGLVEDLPFIHLDQRQRYTIVPDFAGKNAHNRELFLREYGRVTA